MFNVVSSEHLPSYLKSTAFITALTISTSKIRNIKQYRLSAPTQQNLQPWESCSFFSVSMVLYWTHGSIGSVGSCLVGSCRQAPAITMCVYCGDPACQWCFEVVPNIGDVCGNCVVEFGHMMQIYQNHDTKSTSWRLSTKDINAVCSCAFGKHGCSK